MTFGFAPSPRTDPVSRTGRTLGSAEWAAAGNPLLRSPRALVTWLCELHPPAPPTAVIAVLGPDERLAASASFTPHASRPDGWECRNALLGQLRRIIPHDLRRRTPVRTAVLLHCRPGERGWIPVDGAWMWGLRDACTLHGLRCGAYITLTTAGWQVLGEGRGGRRPSAATTNGAGGAGRETDAGRAVAANRLATTGRRADAGRAGEVGRPDTAAGRENGARRWAPGDAGESARSGTGRPAVPVVPDPAARAGHTGPRDVGTSAPAAAVSAETSGAAPGSAAGAPLSAERSAPWAPAASASPGATSSSPSEPTSSSPPPVPAPVGTPETGAAGGSSPRTLPAPLVSGTAAATKAAPQPTSRALGTAGRGREQQRPTAAH